MSSPLYREELLDHFRYPRNSGVLVDAQGRSEVLNPSCGDQISLEIKVDNDRVSEIAFQGKGCVISQASASLLTEFAKGKTVKILEALTKDDMLSLVGIELGPTRLRCALLALEGLQRAIVQYKESHA
jgi:nitrogen fixation protein NifU and related proteins